MQNKPAYFALLLACTIFLENHPNTLPMVKKIIILCISIISSCGIIKAQEWTKKDSTWLLNVLDGKIDLKINEDTKKAIEDGRLITPSWMKNDNSKIKNIDIIKDLDYVGTIDSSRIHSIDPYSMPPAVYALYILYMEKIDSIYENGSIILSDRERQRLINVAPGGYDFNHILSMAFSPLYRQKIKNRKNASIYKGHFYTEPTIKLNERERRELNRAIRNIKRTPTVRTSEIRRGGIDD